MNIAKSLTKINIIELIASIISIIILDKLITLSYLIPSNTIGSTTLSIISIICISIIVITILHFVWKRKRA
ncbi:MAG: hypothetical protein ACRCX8_12915 [Sarcina sp.]